ncbi:MAG: pantetheine-phosphate adenylyltransferase [Bacteroidales bacterium]|nr:pantetheine-phosphate adenylyltransferase [Bacteroidales bacterium]
MSERIALFPGSFDPFTLGHLDVLKSALLLFDKVIIAVGYNSNKSGFLPPEKRVEIIKKAVEGIPNVEVCSFMGLTVDFCREKKASIIVRGLRTTTDFELESVIAQANRKMAPEISSIFIPSGHEYSFISSTVVRDVLANGGDAKCFLPSNINIKDYMSK